MILWYLSNRPPAKAQPSLRSLARAFAVRTHEVWSRRRIQPKIRHLVTLDGCACAFEEWDYGGRKVPLSHDMAHMVESLSLWMPSGLFSLLSFDRSISCTNWATAWQNQQNDLCAQRRQEQPGYPPSFRCPHEETLASYWAHSEVSDQTARMWSESSLGTHHFCWFCRATGQF